MLVAGRVGLSALIDGDPAVALKSEDRKPQDPSRSLRDVAAFFGLTFLLTTPFWAIGAASGTQLLPGLPVAAMAVVCPAAAALFVAWRRGGRASSQALLKRCLDVQRVTPRAWWLLIVLIFPAVSAASFLAMRYSGLDVPYPRIDALATVALFAVFLVGALCEELGWSGFALAPLQARIGAVSASFLVGAIWAIWHYPALLQAHRDAGWIAWWTVGTVSLRIFMVWMFNKTGGSVFAMATLHAISNLCWQLFPVQGSWFDPRINGLIMSAVAFIAILATIHGSRKGDVRVELLK